MLTSNKKTTLSSIKDNDTRKIKVTFFLYVCTLFLSHPTPRWIVSSNINKRDVLNFHAWLLNNIFNKLPTWVESLTHKTLSSTLWFVTKHITFIFIYVYKAFLVDGFVINFLNLCYAATFPTPKSKTFKFQYYITTYDSAQILGIHKFRVCVYRRFCFGEFEI